MKIIPAMDLKEGKIVRLIQGDFNRKTAYQIDPLKTALRYQEEGAKMLHIVDLDGAKTGDRLNRNVIKEMLNVLAIPIQLGGGIRSYEDAKALLDLGVDRVIIGTMALENIEDLKRLINEFSRRIIVALDVKDEIVMVRGWQSSSKQTIFNFGLFLKTLGVETILVTDIAKDGMLSGPNIALYRKLLEYTKLDVIASGGVSSLDDLRQLKTIDIQSVVIGKALLENRFTLKEALQC